MEAYTSQVEGAKRALAERKLEDSYPLMAIKYNRGILFITHNPLPSFKKIREVYSGIAFGGIGDIVTIDKCYQDLVNFAHYRELLYGSKDVKASQMVREVAKQLWQVFNDVRLRPLIIEFTIATLNPFPLIFTVSYDGSIRESLDYSFLGSEARKKVVEQELHSVFSSDLSLDQAQQICKELLKEQTEERQFEVAILTSKKTTGQSVFLRLEKEERDAK